MATQANDYTVKPDVTGLQPATRYYYFFQAGRVTEDEQECSLPTAFYRRSIQHAEVTGMHGIRHCDLADLLCLLL